MLLSKMSAGVALKSALNWRYPSQADDKVPEVQTGISEAIQRRLMSCNF